MTTKWAHLPNAEHIDRVIASLGRYPEAWVAARTNAARYAARNEEWIAAWYAARDEEWIAAWYAARDAAGREEWMADWKAAWGAILALVAYDDCAYLLNCEPDELYILSKLGDHRAILLIPACIAFKKINALQGASFAV